MFPSNLSDQYFEFRKFNNIHFAELVTTNAHFNTVFNAHTNTRTSGILLSTDIQTYDTQIDQTNKPIHLII